MNLPSCTYSQAMPRWSGHTRITYYVISVSSSETMDDGRSRRQAIKSSSRATLMPGIDLSRTDASHLQVQPQK